MGSLLRGLGKKPSGTVGKPSGTAVHADTQRGALNQNWYWWAPTGQDYVLNPDALDVRIYEEMLLTDETLYSGVEFVTMAALAKLGDYTHPDRAIQDFVRRALERMDGSWTEGVAEVLTALWAGFSVTEIIWRYEDQQITLDQLQTLHPATITFDLDRNGPRKNRVRTVFQWHRQQYEVEIPIEKAIVYSHRKRFGNPYGQSRFRACYKDWFLKDVMLKAWGLTMERYGSPHAVAQVANGNSIVNVNGQEMSVFDHVAQALQGLSAKGSMAVDGDTQVSLFQAQRSVGGDFEGLVAYCNKMMYRALMLPSLIADHGQGTGSYSLGQKHFDLFVLMLEKLLDDLVEQLLEQLVRRLVDLNFGPQDDYGDFLIEDFQTDDEKLISETFLNLVNAGVLSPERESDLNQMRERLGYSALAEGLEAPANVEAPSELQPADSQMSSRASLAGRRRRRQAARHKQSVEGSPRLLDGALS